MDCEPLSFSKGEMKKTVAVIGTGIAGMSAAYFLKDRYDITFFEKNNYAGGHTNTLTINENGKDIYVDSAFMVYNEITYPNLTKLFQELDVKTKSTDMSFSVQFKPEGLEYCGTGLNGLFSQRKNLLSRAFWKMLLDMNRFNKESLEVLETNQYESYSISRYVKEKGYGSDFLVKFLIPMGSAVWSNPPGLVSEFPIVTLVRFFKNHGFLGLRGHYQWRTVVEGSQRYRDRILSHFTGKILTDTAVEKIRRAAGAVLVHDQHGREHSFDKIILASHADESLRMLEDPTEQEKNLLGNFSYHRNKATLHTDSSVMPKTKQAWSSWNYSLKVNPHNKFMPTTIYYMNNLQQVSDKKDYFISINDSGDVDPKKILWEGEYDHPVYNVQAIHAQKNLSELNKNGQIYYCGAYFRYGFHEDALTSGIETVKAITGEYPKGYKGF
jgi:predicted NAD/FAD-binding protein